MAPPRAGVGGIGADRGVHGWAVRPLKDGSSTFAPLRLLLLEHSPRLGFAFARRCQG